MSGSQNCGTLTQWNRILHSRKKEGTSLYLSTTWMERENLMLSAISQAVKDKYHMISPISGTQSTKRTSEQNRTRNMEMKNTLTMTRKGVGN